MPAQLHPRDTMDDITEVASTQSIERKNTVTITKNTEIRSKTFISIILGGVGGTILCILTWNLIGPMASSAFILAGMAIAPFLAVGTVRDRTQQERWLRMLNRLRSRSISGQVFYPNSDQPENITDLKEAVFRT